MEAAKDLFRTVPKTNHLGLLNSPKDVPQFLKFKIPDVASATRVPKSQIRFDNRMPDILKERLQEIAVICERVAQYFEGDIEKTALWFQLDNPLLGGISPRTMIRTGRYRKLMQVLDAAMEGEWA